MIPQVKALKKIVRHNTTLIRRARMAVKLNKPKRLNKLQDQWKKETELFKEALGQPIVRVLEQDSPSFPG